MEPTKRSFPSDKTQKVVQKETKSEKSTLRTIENSQNFQEIAKRQQENQECDFCKIFLRVTENGGTRAIEFKQFLMLLINQGLNIVDIFNLLSTNKAFNAEVQYVKNWQHTWTTLNDKEIFQEDDSFNDKMRLAKLSFQQNPGWLIFSLKTCYIGIDSGNLQKRIDNTIKFFTDPDNSFYLRNCRLFIIDLSQETLNPENKIWNFLKVNNFKLALCFNSSEIKTFDLLASLIQKLDDKILENIHSFYLDVVIGNKNLNEVKQLIELLKKCKNLLYLRCGGIGNGTSFGLSELSISFFKLGDMNIGANLQLNQLHTLTHFTCFDVKDKATLNFDNLQNFVCHDIFHANFHFCKFKLLTTFKCQHIKTLSVTTLKNLPNLISFECCDISGSLTLGKGLNNLKSFKSGNIILQKERGIDSYKQGNLIFSDDLPSLTLFECGDNHGSINFYGKTDNLVSIKCGSLQRKEIKAPSTKPTKSRSQAVENYPTDRIFNGKLNLPEELPNLTSLHFKDIQVRNDKFYNYRFSLPETPKLKKISFGRVADTTLAEELRKRRQSICKESLDKDNK